MEGGRDGKQKGIRRNGRKEGMGVDGKEKRKRQEKTKKKLFYGVSSLPACAGQSSTNLAINTTSCHRIHEKGRDGRTGTDEQGRTNKDGRTGKKWKKEKNEGTS